MKVGKQGESYHLVQSLTNGADKWCDCDRMAGDRILLGAPPPRRVSPPTLGLQLGLKPLALEIKDLSNLSKGFFSLWKSAIIAIDILWMSNNYRVLYQFPDLGWGLLGAQICSATQKGCESEMADDIWDGWNY